MNYYKISVIDGKPVVPFPLIVDILYNTDGTAIVSTYETLDDFLEELTIDEYNAFLPPKTEEIPQSPRIDQTQAAIDAIMAGMSDMEVRQTQAIDALMSGMMELYAQNEELKAEIAALKNGGTA
jgi:hypothetical protein